MNGVKAKNSSTVNVSKGTLHSILLVPKFCFLNSYFLTYSMEWQTVQTLIRWSSLIWVCTVCIFHFVRNFCVRNFRIFTVLQDISYNTYFFVFWCHLLPECSRLLWNVSDWSIRDTALDFLSMLHEPQEVGCLWPLRFVRVFVFGRFLFPLWWPFSLQQTNIDLFTYLIYPKYSDTLIHHYTLL